MLAVSPRFAMSVGRCWRVSAARVEKLVVLVTCVVALVVYVVGRWPVSHEAGVLAPEVPTQTAPASPRLIEREADGYQLTPLADYTIHARVLGTERYRFDRIADLVPLDLALGWGSMSDSAVLDRTHLFQTNRHFYYVMPAGILSADAARRSASNVHVIPADDTIRDALFDLKPGDVVRLTGQLVEVDGPRGMTMRSSLRRDDSGDGACEILYVRTVDRDPR